MVKKLLDQAALGAAESEARPIDLLHQIAGGFEINQLLRIAMNVNCHAVITRDDTVRTTDETNIQDCDRSDSMGDLAPYALLSLSGCRG